MGIDLRILKPGDDALLLNCAPGVFDHPVDRALTAEFLGNDSHLIATAIDQGSVVGFASGVVYVHPDKPRELWINEVSVAPAHRRQGLGKAVLKALLEAGRTRRCTVAWVLTHRTNEKAVALYSSLGGTLGADDSGPSEALVGYSFDLGNQAT